MSSPAPANAPAEGDRNTIARDLSVSLALTIVVAVAIAAGTTILYSRADAEARLRGETKRWTKQLAEVSAIHLWNFDQRGLENTCRAAMQPPEVLGARVRDQEGRPLVEVTRRDEPPFASASQDVVHVDRHGQPHSLGSVELWVSEAALLAQLRGQLLRAALLCVAIVVAVVLACQYLLRRFLTQPLEQLKVGIARIATGDYASQLPPAPQAELHAIAQDINAMAAAIASRERDLQMSQEQLREGEERWQLAISSAQDGVWDWNVQDGTLFLSDRWKSMLGFAPDELENSYESWRSRVHPEDQPRILAELQRHLRGETDYYAVAHRLRCKDGSYRWIATRGKLISRTPAGEPLRFVGMHTDTTEQTEAKEALQRAKEAAEQATRAKDEFLANMSHEIRTPLHGVLGMASLLLETELSPEQREYAETIRFSGDALLGVVDDVLDFSRIEAGALTIAEVRFDPRAPCREVEDLLGKEAQRRGLRLETSYAGNLPTAVLGDPGRIRQVLLNLVGNALKYTEEGEVRVAVTLAPGPVNAHVRVRYEVRDTGIGIEPEMQAFLFQRFSQVDSSNTRKRGGTGLGLAISRRLAELMRGEITLESEPGRGSTFALVLPFSTTPDQSEADVAPAPARAPGAPRSEGKVLLAEDNRVSARVAQAILQRLGLRVDTVTTGKAALEALEQKHYDLALLDLQMPELDGFETASRIRQREADRGAERPLPIVALTASALPADEQRCREAGMNAYLRKPITLEALQRELTPLLAESSDRSPKASV